MLQRIRVDATKKGSLREENETFAAKYEQSRLEREELIQRHQAEVKEIHNEVAAQMTAQNTAAQTQLRGENQRLLSLVQLAQYRQEEIDRSELAHSIEIVETRLQLQESLHTELRTLTETHHAEMRTQNEVREQERRSFANELDSLRREVSRLRGVNESLQASKNEIILSNASEISSKEFSLTSKDAILTQQESELASKNAILERQSSTIRELNQQLTRARKVLSGQKPQV